MSIFYILLKFKLFKEIYEWQILQPIPWNRNIRFGKAKYVITQGAGGYFVLAGRNLHTEATPHKRKDAEPSRSPPWGFTPPINFTTGTLNFIGNVNIVVKIRNTHTRTMARVKERDIRNFLRTRANTWEEKQRMKGLFRPQHRFRGEREICHQLGWDTATSKI